MPSGPLTNPPSSPLGSPASNLSHAAKLNASPNLSLSAIQARLKQADIELIIHRRAVKNINFRLKLGTLSVSAPKRLPDTQLAHAIDMRLDWAIRQHHQLQSRPTAPDTLWGQPTAFANDDEKIATYRRELTLLIPTLLATWQPIVGKNARSVRLKNMHTRWGSCNVRDARIWLSVQLAAQPVMCTHYVFVHELCHLHHANHSSDFWAQVARAMPDYQQWHDRLKYSTQP